MPYEQQRDVLRAAIGKINARSDRLSDPKRWERLSLEKQQGLTELLPIIERLSRPDINEPIYQERESMVDTFVQLTIYLGLLEAELAQEQQG